MNSSSPPGRAGYSRRFKLLAPVLVVVALGLFVLAYQRAADSGEDPVLESGGSSSFVEELIPAPDSQVMRQATVGVDLATGWQGTLRLDGQEIPPEQLTVNQALNRVEFTPGAGKVLESLPAGRFCAQAVAWESAVGREGSERTRSWCFAVV